MHSLRVLGCIALSLPLPVAAHGEIGAHHLWTLDPWVLVPMMLLAALHLRGLAVLRARARTQPSSAPYAVASFWAGLAATFLALVWPLDALAASSFAAHMAQHMMLIVVATPLLVLAQPAAPLLAAVPPSWRRINRRLGTLHKVLRRLLHAPTAFAIHGVMIWIWHAPLLFESALRWPWLHVIEHIAFLGSALLFWNALRQAGRAGTSGYATAMLWTLATLMHTGLLGALITFAPRPLYPFYASVEGGHLALMEDQQLAGLLMWIPAGLCYLIIGLGYAAALLRSAQARR